MGFAERRAKTAMCIYKDPLLSSAFKKRNVTDEPVSLFLFFFGLQEYGLS